MIAYGKEILRVATRCEFGVKVTWCVLHTRIHTPRRSTYPVIYVRDKKLATIARVRKSVRVGSSPAFVCSCRSDRFLLVSSRFENAREKCEHRPRIRDSQRPRGRTSRRLLQRDAPSKKKLLNCERSFYKPIYTASVNKDFKSVPSLLFVPCELHRYAS